MNYSFIRLAFTKIYTHGSEFNHFRSGLFQIKLSTFFVLDSNSNLNFQFPFQLESRNDQKSKIIEIFINPSHISCCNTITAVEL